jgi:hypothetical protein
MSDVSNLSITVKDIIVPSYITEIKEKRLSDLLDGFYACLLINTKGLYNYVKSHDASGSHAPTAEPENTMHGMSKYSIYQLVEHIRKNDNDHDNDNDDDVLSQLRNCYAQTGFLAFTDDWKTVFVYSEDDSTWKKWLETAQLDGPASREVYNEFETFL